MPSTYTVNLGIQKPATGEQSGTWGNTTNANFDILDQGINGAIRLTLTSAGSSGSPNALAINEGSVSDGHNKWIEFYSSGDLGGNVFVQLTPNDAEKIVFVRNSLAGSQSVLLFQGTYNSGRDLEIPAGVDMVVKFSGGGASAATVTDVYTKLRATEITTPSLTATTADINGGTIDNSVIGGSTAAAVTGTAIVANTSLNIAGDGATVTGIKDEDNMASNSATKLATQQSIKAYVDAQVGTADTLSEVLGLGNTTGGTDIAVSANDDITFTDSSKAIFGTSSDLQIFHDGSNSYITEGGTGILFLRSNQLQIQSDDGLETYAIFTDNDSVDLYYDNSKKLETTSNGILVTNETDISMDGSASGQFKVQGSGYGFGIALDADAANIYTNSASRDLVFGVDETEVARVKPAGLDVTGATNTTGTQGTRQWSAGSAGQKLGIYAYDNNTFYHRLETGNATNYQWGAYDNIPIYTITNNTVKTTLLGNGNFGINTTNPTQKLEVAGKIQVTSTDPEIFLTDTSTGVDHSIDGNSGVGNLFIHVDKNNEGSGPKFIVNVGATDNIIVANETGNVGIGHTSPVAKMAILGSSNSTITEANSNLCVEGSGGNGLLFGTLNTTGFKSYIQSGFVANLPLATYDLLLNPEVVT